MNTIVDVLIADITISQDRLREDVGDVEQLADSIKRLGQLQPIIIEDNRPELIAGRRRMLACQMLGMTKIMAIRRSDVTPVLSREIELEENLHRLNMSWQETAKAVAEIHKLRITQDHNWSQDQTAAVVGKKQRDVSQAASVVKMMELFPEVANAKSLSQALNIAKAKAKAVHRAIEVQSTPDMYKAIEDRILLGDSVDLIRHMPDEFFHMVLTDPPFGIDYDDRSTGTTNSANAYEDSRESYERILSMAPDLYRVIRKDGFLVWFLGISWYERVKTVFREVGFIVDEIPIIWNRSEGRCFTSRPDRYFGRAYDIALHCLKGEPHLVQRGKPNVISIPPVGNPQLKVERPIELYEELIQRMTIPGEVIGDFFVGSGSSMAAAAKLKREYFGIELSAERRSYAIKKIQAHVPS